jgi:hypothetical protein
MRLFSLLWIALGAALVIDGYSFVGRTLFLDDHLGLQYTNFKFGTADRTSVEIVGYGLCVVGGVLVLFGLMKLLKRRKKT